MWLLLGLVAALDANMRTQDVVAEVLPDGQLVMPEESVKTTVFTTSDAHGPAQVLAQVAGIPKESLAQLEQEIVPFDGPAVPYPEPDVVPDDQTEEALELKDAEENLRKAPDLEKYIGHPFIAANAGPAMLGRVETETKAAPAAAAPAAIPVQAALPVPTPTTASSPRWTLGWVLARLALFLVSALPLLALEVWSKRATAPKDAVSGVSADGAPPPSAVSGVSTAGISDLSGVSGVSDQSCISVTTSCVSVESVGELVDVDELERPWMPLLDLARLVAAVHLVAAQFACGHSAVLPGVCTPAVNAFAQLGTLWVPFIVFSSGFLLVYRSRPGADVARESFVRLAPLYYLGLALGALAAPAAVARGWEAVTPTTVLSALAMADSIIPADPAKSTSLNAAGWIFSALVCMWLVSPRWLALLDQLERKQVWKLLLGCWAATLVPVVASATLVGTLGPDEGATSAFLSRSPVVLAPLFLGGMTWARIVTRKMVALEGPKELGACGVAVLGGLVLASHIQQLQPQRAIQLLQAFPLYPVFCAFLALSAASGHWLEGTPLGQEKDARLEHFLGLLGRLSWPVLLLHWPLTLLVAEHSSTAPHFAFSLSVVLIVCFAYVTMPAPGPHLERGVEKAKLLYSRDAQREAMHETDDATEVAD